MSLERTSPLELKFHSLQNWLIYSPLFQPSKSQPFPLLGEVAHLIPGQPRAINREGHRTLMILKAQSAIDLRTVTAWRLASIPQGQPTLFPEADIKNLSAGYKRAKTLGM